MKGSAFLANKNNNANNVSKNEVNLSNKEGKTIKKIGLIMPISDTEGYKENHWSDVREILEDAIDSIAKEENIECNCLIVSDISGTEKIIQKNIVTNIYDSDLIICDVSSLNPNVMFELGMRLAFDKQIIMVKDEKTKYIFDTNIMFHIGYESNLNYVAIKEFKEELKKDIKKALSSEKENAGYLDAFGDIKVKKVNTETMDIQSAMELMIQEIGYLRSGFNRLDKEINRSSYKKDMLGSDNKIKINNHYTVPSNTLKKRIAKSLVDEITEYFGETPNKEMIEQYMNKYRSDLMNPELIGKVYQILDLD